jgi:hypothetical protein
MKNKRNPDERGEITIVSSAQKNGRSVRTTIPTGIASQVPLKAGSKLLWVLDKGKDGWVITIKVKG